MGLTGVKTGEKKAGAGRRHRCEMGHQADTGFRVGVAEERPQAAVAQGSQGGADSRPGQLAAQRMCSEGLPALPLAVT